MTTERRIRFELVIAICALLISTVAASASWWQARVMQRQTDVLEQQLGAEVWPYISFNETLDREDDVRVAISNDGLGPAVLGSFSAFVDGAPRSSYGAVLHAVLGPHLMQRKPHGEPLGFAMDTGAVGSVVRPGDNTIGFSLRSKRFAPAFIRAYSRIRLRVCYCSIVPGKCWIVISGPRTEPRPVPSCPEISGDLLHAPAFTEITDRDL